MSENKKEIIFKTFQNLAIFSGQKISPERIELYVEYLSKYETTQIMRALKICLETIPYFPAISHILKILDPHKTENDIGNEILSEIMTALKNNGEYQARDVKQTISKSAWDAVEGVGGWTALCRMTYSDLNTARAQIREMGKAVVKNLKIVENNKVIDSVQVKIY